MKRADAEKLLGGYAAGILDEAERKLLFEAALEDQALFDALADEEALRELLADPAARQQLLAALTKAPKVIPFWRRPMVLGAAASLLAVVGGTLLVEQNGARRSRPLPLQEPAPAKTAPPTTATPAETRVAGKAEASRAPAPQALNRATPAAEAKDKLAAKSLPPAEAMADLAPGVIDQSHAKAPKQEETKPMELRAKASEAQPQLNAGAPAVEQPAPAPAPAGELHARKESKRDAAPAGAGGALGGVSGGNFYSAGAAQSTYAFGRAVPQPAWNVEAIGEGRLRVKVLWGPAGHLYLLRRRASGAVIVVPLSSNPAAEGRTESLFLTPWSEGEAFDLYLLPESSKAPATLPAEGPIQGFRTRVWPEPKKTP